MLSRWLCSSLLGLVICCSSAAHSTGAQFQIRVDPTRQMGPVTGRLLLMLSRTNEPEVRLQVGWITSPPVFGIDVEQLRPGQAAVIDESVAGYPLESLRDLPAGDYYVQALLNVYTEFHRADGHTIWAHMDQWEGQQFNRSPGNLHSKVVKLHIDTAVQPRIEIDLTEVIPPVPPPVDTQWIRHVRIQSKLLTAFWGHPMYIGAVVLLPRDYVTQPDVYYPVIYQQGHFGDQPFNFRTEEPTENADERRFRERIGVESGYQFYKVWKSDEFPRAVAITFQHPTPYYDDSYAVNSANLGPYGDAILTELIPYLEEHFRVIREPWARVLTGGSTGGWEALALQLYHPDFFGGTWAFYPDSVDFRRYGLVNIYEDANAFAADSPRDPQWFRPQWFTVERAMVRTDDGQTVATVRQLSQLEGVLGSKGRSGGVLANWEAVYGPVGEDGYPKPLWDKVTGKIDRNVAVYMRDNGYDLRYYAQKNWSTIGSKLVGKLHIYCGEMDNFYLNLGVYLFEQFLRTSEHPHYAGAFEYGRPLKPHGWQPMHNAALVRMMADQMSRNAPMGTSLAWNPNQAPAH